jgi:hypothetical protein
MIIEVIQADMYVYSMIASNCILYQIFVLTNTHIKEQKTKIRTKLRPSCLPEVFRMTKSSELATRCFHSWQVDQDQQEVFS